MVELSTTACGRALDIPALQAGIAEFVEARTLAQLRADMVTPLHLSILYACLASAYDFVAVKRATFLRSRY